MPTQVDPRFFDFSGAFMGGIERAHEQQRRQAMLEMDQKQLDLQGRQIGLQEQRFAQADQERQAEMQAAMKKEGIGLKALAAARGDKQSGLAVLQELGLPPDLADDQEASELYQAIAEQYGGFKVGGGSDKFGNVNPGDYTPESLAKYAQTRNFADLVRQYAPQPAWIGNIAGGIGAIPRVSGGVGQPQMVVDPTSQIGGAAAEASAVAGAKAGAENVAAAQKDLPRLEGNAQEMLGVLQQLENAPGFDIIYGVGSLAPVIPGTKQADAFAIWEQVQGKAFLEAFNTLKGGGQITEKEGEKATAAMTRLANRKQSPTAARQALVELRAIVSRGVERARKAAKPQAGAARRYNPQTGKIE